MTKVNPFGNKSQRIVILTTHNVLTLWK